MAAPWENRILAASFVATRTGRKSRSLPPACAILRPWFSMNTEIFLRATITLTAATRSAGFTWWKGETAAGVSDTNFLIILIRGDPSTRKSFGIQNLMARRLISFLRSRILQVVPRAWLTSLAPVCLLNIRDTFSSWIFAVLAQIAESFRSLLGPKAPV